MTKDTKPSHRIKSRKNKALTERQEKFLEYWADVEGPAFGDAKKAKQLAGYSDNTTVAEVIKPLPDDVIDVVNTYMLSETLKAAKAIVDVRDDPAQYGANTKLKAADSILDRGGIVKKAQVEIKQETPSAVFFLPAKTGMFSDSDDSDEYDDDYDEY
jgi:hypothetical protein